MKGIWVKNRIELTISVIHFEKKNYIRRGNFPTIRTNMYLTNVKRCSIKPQTHVRTSEK